MSVSKPSSSGMWMLPASLTSMMTVGVFTWCNKNLIFIKNRIKIDLVKHFSFEKYPCEGSFRYAICGYATIYLYFAYPNKTRPRISQFLVLPPFQRMGLGAELLNVVYRSFLQDSYILDITGMFHPIPLWPLGIWFNYYLRIVEDPSEEFVRLRDFVDVKNCMKLEAFSKEKLRDGFSNEMVKEAQSQLKINKVCNPRQKV